MLTCQEVADKLNLTRSAVYHYVRGNKRYKGRLEFNKDYFKLGNVYLITYQGLEKIKEIRDLIHRN